MRTGDRRVEEWAQRQKVRRGIRCGGRVTAAMDLFIVFIGLPLPTTLSLLISVVTSNMKTEI